MLRKVFILACALMAAPLTYCQDYNEERAVQIVETETYSQVDHNAAIPEEEPKVSNLKYFAAHLATGALAVAVGKEGSSLIATSNDKFLNFFVALSVLTILWQIPQWTDKLLGIKKERSTADNVISFGWRELLLPYPLGTLVSELSIQNHH